MKSVRTRALVLRRTNYGEADRILQLLTPIGRMSVMARGVRRERSRLAGGIELFAISDVVVGRGKGELGILTSARLVQFYRHILDDYDRMLFAYEVLKQVGKASETLDEPEWFNIVSEVLVALGNKAMTFELTRLWFYLHFSAMLGYELNVMRDIEGDLLRSDSLYQYDVSEKGLAAAQSGDITASHIKLLRLASIKTLPTLAQIGGLDEIVAACVRISREHATV